MMQNSLERVLAGVATTLHDDVLPQLNDTYARSQVEAAVELIVSLIDQTEWRCDLLRATVDEALTLLIQADRVAPEDEPDVAAARALLAGAQPSAVDRAVVGNADLVVLHRDSLAALAGVQRWVAQRDDSRDNRVAGIAAAVDSFVRSQFSSDLDNYAAIRRRVRAVVLPRDR